MLYSRVLACVCPSLASPGDSVARNPPAVQEPQEMGVPSLGQEDPLEEDVATHSNILAWRTPWTERPGKLCSIGSQRTWLKQFRIHAWICFSQHPNVPLPPCSFTCLFVTLLIASWCFVLATYYWYWCWVMLDPRQWAFVFCCLVSLFIYLFVS